MKNQAPEGPEIMVPGSEPAGSAPRGSVDEAPGGSAGRRRGLGFWSVEAGIGPHSSHHAHGTFFSQLRQTRKSGFGARHFLLGAGIALLALVLMVAAVVIGLVVALLARLVRLFGFMKPRPVKDSAPALEARPTARGWITD